MATNQGPDPVTFGDLLRRHRLSAGLTQEELAERAHMSARGISDLERGARTRPQRESRTLLADALGLEGSQRSAFLVAARPGVSSSRNAAARSGVAGQSFPDASLPVPPNPLIGRTAEVAMATALLRNPAARLLTLTGAGGSGKTRLAIETAIHLRPDFPDGVVFVGLAPLSDAGLVPNAIAAALGVSEQPGLSLIESVVKALAARQVLLVLDNFEHVLAAAQVIPTLLSAAPDVKVLVTSRTRLALTAEQELPVSPLDVPDPSQQLSLEQFGDVDAVRLFVSRACTLQPDFTLTEENALAVAAICQRLDGLPLALELAAARVKLLPPQALLARLERSLSMLTGGARDLPTRQQTLRNTIAWSYDLLSEDDRRLLRRLAVFVGGWTLEAAESCGNFDGTLDVLEGMASLVDKSLVRHVDHIEGEPRFRMLETIREFALEALAENDEESIVRDAHAAYFAALGALAAPELTGANQVAWLNRLQAEHANLRAALDWLQRQERTDEALRLAASLRWFWLRRGHTGEGAERLAALLEASESSSGLTWAKAAAVAAHLAKWRQDRTRGEELFGLAIPKLREGDDRHDLALALCGLSDIVVDGHDCERAEALAEEALMLARELGDTWLEALATNSLGMNAASRLDYPLAAARGEASLRLFRAAADPAYVCQSLGNLAWTVLNLGDLARARALYSEQLTLATRVADPWWLVWGVEGFARLAVASGEAARAARLFGAAAAHRKALGIPLRPLPQRVHDREIERSQTELGPDAFAAAWEEGQTLSIARAVDEALRLADKTDSGISTDT